MQTWMTQRLFILSFCSILENFTFARKAPKKLKMKGHFHGHTASQWQNDTNFEYIRWKRIPARTPRAHPTDSTISALRSGFPNFFSSFFFKGQSGIYRLISTFQMKIGWSKGRAFPKLPQEWDLRNVFILLWYLSKDGILPWIGQFSMNILKVELWTACWTCKGELFQAEGQHKEKVKN